MEGVGAKLEGVGAKLEGVGALLEGVGYSKHALTCLIGCRLPPLDGYMAVCLVLTIEVYGIS